MKIVRELKERKTMLTKNIVKDHHLNMVIGTMEITLAAGKKNHEEIMGLEIKL